MTSAAVRHLTTQELAERLDVSPHTVRRWRLDGRGPAYISSCYVLIKIMPF